jgi:hypothetical protein
MSIVTRKQLLQELLPGLNKLFGTEYVSIEYHARRTEHDPKLWRVLEITLEGSEKVSEKELATDLKRNRAQALVKLLRSNQKHGS